MENKLGIYISNLMSTVLDEEERQFVRDLAMNELKRLKIDVEEFIRKHTKDDSDAIKKTEKQLLQEETENGKNK